MAAVTKQRINHWISEARDHWAEFRPSMYEELEDAGELEAALQRAAENTASEMQSLMDEGMPEWQAWPMVREKYIYLPPGEGYGDDEEEEMPITATFELMKEIQKEIRDIRNITYGDDLDGDD